MDSGSTPKDDMVTSEVTLDGAGYWATIGVGTEVETKLGPFPHDVNAFNAIATFHDFETPELPADGSPVLIRRVSIPLDGIDDMTLRRARRGAMAWAKGTLRCARPVMHAAAAVLFMAEAPRLAGISRLAEAIG